MGPSSDGQSNWDKLFFMLARETGWTYKEIGNMTFLQILLFLECLRESWEGETRLPYQSLQAAANALRKRGKL